MVYHIFLLEIVYALNELKKELFFGLIANGNRQTHLLPSRSLNMAKFYLCEKCGKSYAKLHGLRAHLEAHHGKEGLLKACPICMKTVILMSEHLRMHRESAKCKHKCNQCAKVYPRSSILAAHIRRAHTGERPFVCPHCKKGFAAQSGLRGHQNVSPPRLCKAPQRKAPTLKCPLCPKLFVKKHTLKYHMNTHSGAFPFRCRKCWKAFQHPNQLGSHRKECRQVFFISIQRNNFLSTEHISLRFHFSNHLVPTPVSKLPFF